MPRPNANRSRGLIAVRTVTLLVVILVSVIAFRETARAQPTGAVTLRLREVARISGYSDGSPDGFLVGFAKLVAAPDGSIIVPQRTSLKVFDPRGGFVRTLGREGRGPGEFLSTTLLGWSGDSLWVYDGIQRRVTYFRHDGSFIKTVKPVMPRVASHEQAGVLTWLSNGRTLVRVADRADSLKAARTLLVGSRGEVIQSLWSHPRRRSGVAVRIGKGTVGIPQPFADHPLFAITPQSDEMLVVERPSPANATRGIVVLRRFALDGRLLSSSEHAFVPRRLTRRDADSALRTVARHIVPRLRAQGQPVTEAAFITSVRPVLYSPRFIPPYTDVLLGTDRTAWLRRDGTRNRWLVLEPTGAVKGTVEVPSDGDIMYAGANTIVAVEYDEAGVPSVVRYTVTK